MSMAFPQRVIVNENERVTEHFQIEEEVKSSDEESSDDEDEDKEMNLAMDEILKTGWLKKEGKVWKSWKSRYFVLDSHGVLSCFKSDKSGDLKDPISRIVVVDAELNEVSMRNGALSECECVGVQHVDMFKMLDFLVIC